MIVKVHLSPLLISPKVKLFHSVPFERLVIEAALVKVLPDGVCSLIEGVVPEGKLLAFVN